MNRALATALATLVGLALTACSSTTEDDPAASGDESSLAGSTGAPAGEGPRSAVQELVDRLAADADEPADIVAADFAAARTAADLPADADPYDYFDRVKPAESRFGDLIEAVPHLVRPQESPALEVIDAGLITAAATSRGVLVRVTVIRTDQDVEEIADGLTERGYDRDGDLLTFTSEEVTERIDAVYSHVAIGDGVVALAERSTNGEEAVTAAKPAPVATEIGEQIQALVDSAGAAAISYYAVELPCVAAVAVLEPVDADASMVFTTDAPADVDVRLADGPLADYYDFGEPETADGQVSVTVATMSDGPGALRILSGETPLDGMVACA